MAKAEKNGGRAFGNGTLVALIGGVTVVALIGTIGSCAGKGPDGVRIVPQTFGTVGEWVAGAAGVAAVVAVFTQLRAARAESIAALKAAQAAHKSELESIETATNKELQAAAEALNTQIDLNREERLARLRDDQLSDIVSGLLACVSWQPNDDAQPAARLEVVRALVRRDDSTIRDSVSMLTHEPLPRWPSSWAEAINGEELPNAALRAALVPYFELERERHDWDRTGAPHLQVPDHPKREGVLNGVAAVTWHAALWREYVDILNTADASLDVPVRAGAIIVQPFEALMAIERLRNAVDGYVRASSSTEPSKFVLHAELQKVLRDLRAVDPEFGLSHHQQTEWNGIVKSVVGFLREHSSPSAATEGIGPQQ
jgi:flagellar biosynthesis regulator FlaF